MTVKVLSKSNTEEKQIALPKEVISATNHKVISEYINFVRAAGRGAIANTKDRSEVSGGGKKPWKQKGTGHARHGSSRSPLWVGGGVTFGPTNDRNFWLNHPKRFRQYARYCIFNIAASEKKMVIIDNPVRGVIKTRDAEDLLQKYGFEGKITLILSEKELAESVAYRNLPYIWLMCKSQQNMIQLASSDKIVFSRDGYDEYFAKKETGNETDN